MQQIRLLIMCEHQGVRRGLSSIFTSQDDFKVLGEVGCSLDSITDVLKIQPDAIIIKLDSDNHIRELLPRIKEYCPNTKVLVFVKNETFNEARAAFEAGADGCLSKIMLPGDLVKAVELSCRANIMCMPCYLKQRLNRQINIIEQGDNYDENVKVSLNGSVESSELDGTCHLTTREKEIYKLIAQGESNKEIGKKLFISQPTVKSHVSSILHKLGLNSRTQLVLNDINKKLSHNGEQTNIIELKQ